MDGFASHHRQVRTRPLSLDCLEDRTLPASLTAAANLVDRFPLSKGDAAPPARVTTDTAPSSSGRSSNAPLDFTIDPRPGVDGSNGQEPDGTTDEPTAAGAGLREGQQRPPSVSSLPIGRADARDDGDAGRNGFTPRGEDSDSPSDQDAPDDGANGPAHEEMARTLDLATRREPRNRLSTRLPEMTTALTTPKGRPCRSSLPQLWNRL